MTKANLLLIGFGRHARRIYYPVAQADGPQTGFAIACGVDLVGKKDEIDSYLSSENNTKLTMRYLWPEQVSTCTLAPEVEDILNQLVQQHSVRGVIISTDPHAHMGYATWALEHGLSVLMDKPVSIRSDASTREEAALGIGDDFERVDMLYQKAKLTNQHLLFSMMAQRRYHPAFLKVKSLIAEVFEATNCPITSIQSFHSDGQWRLPTEIIDVRYHSFNDGYGKCSHTGYHTFDIVPWFLEAAESPDKKIDNVDVFTSFMRPIDFLCQLTPGDYARIFPDFERHDKYTPEEFERLTRAYGEIDAFSHLAFRHGDRTITLGSVNLAHNGFSQRGWVSCEGRDLYKGNGRVRHETHFLEQGPFQAISLISYQSEEVNPNQQIGIFDVGGEYHLDIHVFRNSSLFPQWKSYEKYGMQDFGSGAMTGLSRGHQEDARRECILEFARHILGASLSARSDLSSHRRGVTLQSAVYRSASRRFCGSNPLVKVDFPG